MTINDPRLIANNFNEFFVKIGPEIKKGIDRTEAKAENFMPTYNNLIELELTDISPIHICDIIKSLTSKSSVDAEGLSTKLLKSIYLEICTPLAHIFTLSIRQGIFPKNL